MKGKQITQETFDATVKENIEEFQMSWESALADAIQQFQALGVDLQNIVTSRQSFENNAEGALTFKPDDGASSNETSSSTPSGQDSSTYPATKAQKLISELKNVLLENDGNNETIIEKLNEVITECELGLPQRCLLGTNNITPILFDACVHSSVEISSKSFRTLVALTNGQPDVLTPSNITFILEKLFQVIDDKDTDSDLLIIVLRLIRNGCVKHETNRQRFVDDGLIRLLLVAMEQHRSVPEVIQVASLTLKSLTLDDDVRVPFGRAHQHAKMIVVEHGGLRILLDVASEFVKDMITLTKVLSTLSCLAVRNEFCQAIVDEGGLTLVLKAMLENIDTQAVVKVGLQLLKAIAGNDGVKNEIVKSGGVDIILNAMSKHQLDKAVCQAGCACLAALALRSPDNCRLIIDAGGSNGIVDAIKVHGDDLVTLQSAFRAVTNLVNRTKHNIPIFLDLGIEMLIINARSELGSPLQTDANSLLFLLGCKAEMKELWTGKKGHLDD